MNDHAQTVKQLLRCGLPAMLRSAPLRVGLLFEPGGHFLKGPAKALGVGACGQVYSADMQFGTEIRAVAIKIFSEGE